MQLNIKKTHILKKLFWANDFFSILHWWFLFLLDNWQGGFSHIVANGGCM